LLHARLDDRRNPAKCCPLLSGCRCAVEGTQ
jgi:hypothetical protein